MDTSDTHRINNFKKKEKLIGSWLRRLFSDHRQDLLQLFNLTLCLSGLINWWGSFLFLKSDKNSMHGLTTVNNKNNMLGLTSVNEKKPQKNPTCLI